MKRSFSTTALVLKRSNTGETDRVVTLLTQSHGKLVSVAKGVRKISSSKRAFLEPGNLVKGFFINTKSMPLLTQAELISDCCHVRTSLPRIRQLSQFLEILDKLFVEEEIGQDLFNLSIKLRNHLITIQKPNGLVKQYLGDILVQLGYQHPLETSHETILDYVSELADRKMRSFEYLRT
jgi:DNA repair protein RecO